jgi:uncharacterized protein involved in exopolysaccharide biosynthesis
MLQSVNEFNLRKRQEQASAEQAFVQARLDQARSQLRAAEDALQTFLQQNRQYAGDPALSFAHDRLRRDVDMRQVVYTSLSQAYEQASLQALRETPSIVVVQRPQVSTTPEGRGIALKGITVLALGIGLAVLVAFSFEHLTTARRKSPKEFEELAALRRSVRDDLSRSIRARLKL